MAAPRVRCPYTDTRIRRGRKQGHVGARVFSSTRCDPFRAGLFLEAGLVLSVGSGAGGGGVSQKLELYFGYSSLKNECTIRQRKKSNEIKNVKFLELNGHSLRL